MGLRIQDFSGFRIWDLGYRFFGLGTSLELIRVRGHAGSAKYVC